jgi:hypothetical protein
MSRLERLGGMTNKLQYKSNTRKGAVNKKGSQMNKGTVSKRWKRHRLGSTP